VYRRTLSAAVLASSLLIVPAGAALADTTESAPALTYSVTPVFPENQQEGINSYYSLQSSEGSLDQDITVKVTNTAEVPQTITVDTVNAYTSANGVIQYTSEMENGSVILDENYELDNHVRASVEQLDLDPGQTEEVTLDVDVDGVTGTVLGGVAFSTLSDEQEVQDGINIINKVNTIVGIAVNMPGDNAGELSVVDGVRVNPMPTYYTVDVPLRFDVPAVSKEATMEYTVIKDGEKIFTGESVLDFAPMTGALHAVPFTGDSIEENTPYTISGSITYDRYGQSETVAFSKEFTYSPDSTEPTTDPFGDGRTLEPPTVESDEEVPHLVLALIAGTLVVGMIGYGVYRVRRTTNVSTEGTAQISQD
jgi:hypothetical protein